MALRKLYVPLWTNLTRKSTRDLAPKCALCLKTVDQESIVDQNRREVKVLVRCHGAEELATFELGADWTHHELQRAMSRKRWFWQEEEGV